MSESPVGQPSEPSEVPAQVSSAAPGRVAYGCAIAFGLAFVVAGLVVLRQGVEQHDASGTTQIIIGGVFTLVGLLLLIGILYGASRLRQTSDLKARYPGQPWMWRDDWARSAIGDSNKAKTLGLWIFSVLWNAITFPVAWKLAPEFSRENLAMLLVFLFPFAGIMLLFGAVYQTLRSMRFGTSVCHLDRVPVVPGRTFRGEVEIRTEQVAADGYRLRILLVNAVTSRTSRKQSTTESLVWDSEIVVDSSLAMRSPVGTRVPFQFATPPDVHPTDDSDFYNRFLWRLTASAQLAGVDYDAQFDLPVFQTGEAADGSEFEAFQRQHRVEAARQEIAPGSGVEITQLSAGGEEFHIRAPLTFGSVLGGLLFLAVWNAGVVASIYFHLPWGFPAVLIALDLLFLASSVDYFFGRSTIQVDANGLRVRRQWLGMGRERAVYEAPDVASIDGTTAGAESKAFGVTLKLSDGMTKLLASNLRDRESADAVAARMMANLRKA
jgi:hypothetical protein